MRKSNMNLVPIGIIHSPFKKAEGTPIQPVYAQGAEGTIEIFREYSEGLSDLEGFERIWLIYFFDRVSSVKLRILPFRDDKERGLFATRAPCRPNPIGLSAVRLVNISGTRIRIADIDVLDGTPLIDIKPYIPHVDSFPHSRAGWFNGSSDKRTSADDRFD